MNQGEKKTKIIVRRILSMCVSKLKTLVSANTIKSLADKDSEVIPFDSFYPVGKVCGLLTFGGQKSEPLNFCGVPAALSTEKGTQ